MPTEEEAAVRFHPTLDHPQRGGSSAAARTRSHKAIGHTCRNNCAKPAAARARNF